ncbi:hypothetical protein G7054_g8315 [Neopestalotiopsis clavispora]|nr:hypothetical protein G7054_g8315 [Neopestalotiopsis clavispora]
MADWEQIGAKKRQALGDLIPSEWVIPAEVLPPHEHDDVSKFGSSGWFTSEELEITESSVASLLPKLASGALKSETVTRAFCKRAAAAHQLTNCLSEICFDRAIEDAKAIDQHLEKTGHTVGPLHGLPISIKDNFDVVDLDTTIGFASHVGNPATKDSDIVTILRRAGAVIYVKTNVPTAMMLAETVNNTFGRTLNPLNRKLTSGGSSGGESALIACRGSPIGIGTDIGGSLRIPAACTGLYSLRPSFGRFPTLGTRSGLPGQEVVQSVGGPIASSLEDLETLWKIVIDAEPWRLDPRCLPIPWCTVDFPQNHKLKIAVMWNDGVVMPTPPVARALKTAVDRLIAAGHEVTEWLPTDHLHIIKLLGSAMTADGGASIRKELEKTGEPWLPELERYQNASEISTTETWELNAKRTTFQRGFLSRWENAGIDAILCPVSPWSGAEHTKFKYDDPAIVDNMPINLQVVGRRLEEEKVVAMTKVVQATIKRSDKQFGAAEPSL